MVRVLFLFLTRFHVNIARNNGNKRQSKFSRQKLTHAYYAFASYVRREGHLYEVFLVLAKTRLIFSRINGPIERVQLDTIKFERKQNHFS